MDSVFFEAGAELPKHATTIEFGQLPIPVHGTFWLAVPDGLDVRGLFTAMETVTTQRAVKSGLELLQANVGRAVRVTLAGDDEVIDGTILSVPAPVPGNDSNPYMMGGAVTPNVTRTQSHAPQIVLLETASGVVGLSAGAIRHVEFPGLASAELATSLPATEELPSLRLELDAPSRGQTVGVSFLASGLTWAPSYRIDLSEPKIARFTAKAVVVNEVADLDGVQLDLVTGFPNVAFSAIRSPMAMGQTLEQFLSQLGRPAGGTMGGMFGQQAILVNRADYSPVALPGMDFGEPSEGASAEDLFFYPVNDVHLDWGETVTLPLFTADMPYEHVYTWHVSDKLDDNEQYRRSDRDREAEEVWHSCRLINTLDMPPDHGAGSVRDRRPTHRPGHRLLHSTRGRDDHSHQPCVGRRSGGVGTGAFAARRRQAIPWLSL